MYCLTFNLCRGYLGTGSVDFTGLFRGLAAIRYSGPITFESFSSEVRSTTTVTTYLQLHKYVDTCLCALVCAQTGFCQRFSIIRAALVIGGCAFGTPATAAVETAIALPAV